MVFYYVTLVIISAIICAIPVLYLLTLQKSLRLVSPKNRGMHPSFVWFNLIPIISLLWYIYSVVRISKSIKSEVYSRGVRKGDGGFTIGLLASLSFCFIAIIFIFCPTQEDLIPGYFLIGVIFTLFYWIIIRHYNRIMAGELKLNQNYNESDIKVSSLSILITDLFGLAWMSFFVQVILKKFMQIFKEMNVANGLPPHLTLKANYYVQIFIITALVIIAKEVLIKIA